MERGWSGRADEVTTGRKGRKRRKIKRRRRMREMI